jgi:hypothetical protein
MSKSSEKAATMGGLAVICCLVSGFGGLLGGIFSIGSMNLIGAGVCFGAAGLSFGLAANAIWRN